jgi:hypothetical protein
MNFGFVIVGILCGLLRRDKGRLPVGNLRLDAADFLLVSRIGQLAENFPAIAAIKNRELWFVTQ